MFSVANRMSALEPSTWNEVSSVQSDKVEISSGKNSYQKQVVTFDGEVELHYKGQSVYCDHMIYDRSTKTLTATGNARIFNGTKSFSGQKIVYSLKSKAIISRQP